MKTMIRNSSVFSGAIILALALSVLATPADAWVGPRDEIRIFQNFLQSRPRIAAELRSNPRLVYDRRYLERRSDLAHFLRRYPWLRREIATNPHRVLGSSYRTNRPYPGWGWGYYR
jgi:hypothetical protein